MIAVSRHSGKTSFAGGVNIFHASQQHLTQRRDPVESPPIATTLKQEEILAILADGYFTLAALSKKVDISTIACYERLKRLGRDGVVKSRQCAGTRAREYTLGRPAEATLTMTEQVMHLIRTEPFLTAREISKRLDLGKLTSTVARLFAQGDIARRKNRRRIYVYYVA